MSHTLPAKLVRWGARSLNCSVLLVWGFFLIAHLVGDEGRAARPLARNDYLILSTLLLSLAGLALAWKWERAGAAVALAAVGACAAFNWKVLAFPAALIPATAALHLLSWWARRQARPGDAARVR